MFCIAGHLAFAILHTRKFLGQLFVRQIPSHLQVISNPQRSLSQVAHTRPTGLTSILEYHMITLLALITV